MAIQLATDSHPTEVDHIAKRDTTFCPFAVAKKETRRLPMESDAFSVCQVGRRDYGLAFKSLMPIFISSELPRSSGAYMAWATAGRALNLPGISARRR